MIQIPGHSAPSCLAPMGLLCGPHTTTAPLTMLNKNIYNVFKPKIRTGNLIIQGFFWVPSGAQGVAISVRLSLCHSHKLTIEHSISIFLAQVSLRFL